MLKKQICAGHYAKAYQVQGQYLHATQIIGNQVAGYLGPPSHTPTKLYNMNNISSWQMDGKHILFLSRPMVTTGPKMRTDFDNWDDSPLRCVHTRFLRRSSLEPNATIGKRLHGEDCLGFGNRTDRGGTDKVNERLIYKKGQLVTKSINWLTNVNGEMT